jgi:hypothetical protein
MIDFILFVFVCLVFGAGVWLGFYLGKTYQTCDNVIAGIKAKVKAKL